MAVTAQMVKELRERTGAGMMDCKGALDHTNGDIEAAIDYLREKGIAKAAKKAGRIAAEGLCSVVTNGNQAVIFELNSETDFVSKNSQFLDLLDKVGNTILNSKASNADEALALLVDGKTIEFLLADATAKIGEKISLRRVSRVVKTDGESFGAYKHMGGRIAVLAVIGSDNAEVAKDIAMHVAAQNPKYLDRSQVDQATLDHEKKVLTQQAIEEGKPANIAEKMVIGRLNKYLQDICLVDQGFVKDPDLKVSDYLKSHKSSVLSFIRLAVGEGIEKKEEDFAAEVAAVTQASK
ncbi:MAG TPA: elongation factor Ts [Acholeplasmataceae bacterium]|nr:MAG: translation elongation factor Ts [Tenericutes bacterium GWA2_38_26]OHE32314.1 MAG: translation elongation factor Ts [Tenericutes bacterium GWD2_38_27]OHE40236.1 MAG: translation elongation factor Ts [Tenericutes bacterium GWE2_38_8]OHE40860.1 MAG: translation elongation factor Ts [Tenericutes bacterium GWF2_38_8]HBY65615.1 elongation factor Ts [Acholeplasmataceae bacterium]